MVTIEVPAKLTVDDLVTAVSQLPNPELATFLQRVVAIQTQREMFQPGTENEQALIKTIQKQHLTRRERQRLKQLRQKREEETLSASEHAELLEFVQRVEQHDLDRTKALVELAQKRNTTLSKTMHTLNIEPEYA